MTHEEAHSPKQRRLAGYDYSQAGIYFVTIATSYHLQTLGTVVDGQLHHSPSGVLAESVWRSLPTRFAGLDLDVFVVMPNHLHGLLILPDQSNQLDRFTLSDIVRTFKAASTRLIRSQMLPSFAWQPNYHEHVVRNEADVNRIREYIVTNPLRWSLDRANLEPSHSRPTQRSS
jgi:REP element-mobilizing transposase RayT